MEGVNEKLAVQHLYKSFPGQDGKQKLVIQDLTFSVRASEFLVVLGPGLCGKTVLMNMIAGLETPTQGEIRLDGELVRTTTSKVSMVFQRLGLLNWKTVQENVEIGPKYQGIGKKERHNIAQRYIDMVGLHGFEKAYPRQLSGGMKQRVGIARAYAARPQVMVLDEPFGQLDAQTRFVMEKELLKSWEQEKKTVVFVTNNLEEALFLGDRIILLTNCPARIQTEYEVDLPRPRDTVDARFLQLRQEISDHMELSI